MTRLSARWKARTFTPGLTTTRRALLRLATSEDNITRARTKKLDTVDEITDTLHLVQALEMAVASDSVPVEIGEPLQTLIVVIKDKLEACAKGLEIRAAA
jgi:hypothetical protein